MDTNECTNVVPERWSGPWHALQRRLAEGFRVEAARAAAGAITPSRRLAGPEGAASCMARARNPIHARTVRASRH
jgi:hypothetical protein